ncbi:hypothetical protein AJ80_06353 [Polytolypa hystricis UAMH7299]|uniref:ferric-chelate reductase (NADPH) n=1 Tax=Polytolypa hystricis (strain UAMH7299) TaxID=1447883 RepID=A0A2B7XWP5_POLH7|nr:hypothetical protein AJ80_06353 [Polytolypa hystricis UAMH7299]
MDHNHGDMSNGDMNMGNGVPSLFHMQKMYWAVIGAVIGVATVANVLNKILAVQRFSDRTSTPSKPKSLFFRTYATLTAMTREVSHASISPLTIGKLEIRFPSVGRLILALSHLVVILVFCFYKLNTTDEWSWENIGYRTGFMAISMLPLVILLSGKNNIIGLLTGTSHERLNWLHRWISRTLWLVTTIHMCFWFRSWGRYNYIIVKLKTDPFTQTGFAAWCVLTFIVLVSMAPVRRLSYEVFVLLHLLTFGGFVAAVWYHAPSEVKIWVWIPIGLFAFDRITRFAVVLVSNLSFFHRGPHKEKLWANYATFTPLPGDITRVTIPSPVVSWKPGQHVFLGCHSIVPGQSHPFSISSLPSDDKMEFLVRAERGGTKHIFNHASKHHTVLGGESLARNSQMVSIEGPYGRIRPLRQFDSVVLLAGGMGASYTMPLMRDIVRAWKEQSPAKTEEAARISALRSPRNHANTKRIRFVWVIRSRSHLTWFSDQLLCVMADMDACRLQNPAFDKDIEISVYITCDEKMTLEPAQTLNQQRELPSVAPTSQPEDIIQETKGKFEDTISTRESSIDSPGSASTVERGCLPKGGCCCTKIITDENDSGPPPCTCSGPAPPKPQPPIAQTSPDLKPEETTPKPTTTPPTPAKPQPTLESHIRIISGRPDTSNIIRKVLEQAEGESGVVVCGPRGLSTDVRRNVVSLSDERAVHKGTGAQGIYLHVEAFEY